MEEASNFHDFFTNPNHKIRDVRNVWLLNYRNFGDSDHHDSFNMHDISQDIVRFMDDHQITMATIGGHGFGGKVATATASLNLNRFTGVVSFDSGPIDHRYHEAYRELVSYVDFAHSLNLSQFKDTASA